MASRRKKSKKPNQFLGREPIGGLMKQYAVSCIISLLVGALYNFSDRIIAMFGGTVNSETFRHSKAYFFYITLGIPFYMFGQALNPIIRADGNPKFAIASTLAGAVINMIPDPIYIFGCHWGMMGAGKKSRVYKLFLVSLQQVLFTFVEIYV